MNDEIETRAKKETLVLLDEDCGNRMWFWFPKKNSNELIDWWKTLDSVEPYFKTPESLPGDVIQVFDDKKELLKKLDLDEIHFCAHIHCNDDSVLQTPDGDRVYHRGFKN